METRLRMRGFGSFEFDWSRLASNARLRMREPGELASDWLERRRRGVCACASLESWLLIGWDADVEVSAHARVHFVGFGLAETLAGRQAG